MTLRLWWRRNLPSACSTTPPGTTSSMPGAAKFCSPIRCKMEAPCFSTSNVSGDGHHCSIGAPQWVPCPMGLRSIWTLPSNCYPTAQWNDAPQTVWRPPGSGRRWRAGVGVLWRNTTTESCCRQARAAIASGQAQSARVHQVLVVTNCLVPSCLALWFCFTYSDLLGTC